EGLKEAMAGAQVVIDLANSPSFEAKAVLETPADFPNCGVERRRGGGPRHGPANLSPKGRHNRRDRFSLCNIRSGAGRRAFRRTRASLPRSAGPVGSAGRALPAPRDILVA